MHDVHAYAGGVHLCIAMHTFSRFILLVMLVENVVENWSLQSPAIDQSRENTAAPFINIFLPISSSLLACSE